MALFLILALLIVVVAVIAAGGMFSGGRRTHIIERTVVSDPVDEVVEEPVTSRRVLRRRVR